MSIFQRKNNIGGMTAIELIVVVGIFAVITSAVAFNYGKFQAKIEIRNLANEIALKIVQAQKSSIDGKWIGGFGTNKPSYGLYFNTSAPTKFAYFADLDSSNTCTGAQCTPPYSVGGEVLEVVTITKGNSISGLGVAGAGCSSPTPSNLTLVFRRPNSSPNVVSSPALGCIPSNIAVDITSPSPSSLTASIKLYASGRVQIN